MRCYLIAASILGFLAVLLGAFGAHGLASVLSTDALASWKTAVQYQMFHALMLMVLVALYRQHSQHQAYFAQSGLLILSGTILFSGSIYLLLLLKWRWLGPVTPLGGLLLMAGWLRLFIGVWRDKS